MLNHTSGLHNALASHTRENPLLMTDWDQCLNLLTTTSPETEPGREQLYHYLSFGWLCGGIIEVIFSFSCILFHICTPVLLGSLITRSLLHNLSASIGEKVSGDS